MKVLDKSNIPPRADVPVVPAVPLAPPKTDSARAERAEVLPVRPAFSNAEAAAITFLRQFRVLVGAARLYQRNHPRLMEILASTEQQLRIALAASSPLVVAVERRGMSLPQQEGGANELLHDPRGELRGLAEELLRCGICSLLFTYPINVGELDLFSREISHVPRTASPGDTASRRLWDNWIKDRSIAGIRLNIPTERRDSLSMASLMSAVLAYDDAAKRSSHSGGTPSLPEATFEQVAAALRILAKLTLPQDPEMRPSTEDLARRFHSVVSTGGQTSISLLVHGVSNVKPREGETLEPYLERLADTLVLGFVKQEFDAGRTTVPGLMPLLVSLDQERGQAANAGDNRFAGSQHDEVRVAALCEKFWSTLPARARAKVLLSSDAWCVPAFVLARFLEPLAAAAEKKNADASARKARSVLLSYAGCLESEENKARRAVAVGLGEIAPQFEKLWPHPLAQDFGRGIVRALLDETSPGIAGLLSAVVEKLARIALLKREYTEFERILEDLEAAPRDQEHAHITTLVSRILNDDQWLYLVDEALGNHALHPAIPRLLKRRPDRLIDRLSLLLTSANGMNALPAMVRLIHATGEPVLGALEVRLYEARRQRIVTAIHLLASTDPKRLAGALPKALASWEWSLQDFATTELMKWTNPPIVAAAAQAFLKTLSDAHPMVVPCMIDHLGTSRELAALPVLLKIAEGQHVGLQDIYLRIKAAEALGRMRAAESAPMLRRIVRDRNGLAYNEPAALRFAAEEALANLENRPTSARSQTAESAGAKSGTAYSRARRYARVRMKAPLAAAITGARTGAARIRVIALGGAFLETDPRLAIGDSLHLEFRAGLRKIESTAVVRNVTASGVGVEFVHLKPSDRERLRRLVAQQLE
jgi:PilZ domain